MTYQPKFWKKKIAFLLIIFYLALEEPLQHENVMDSSSPFLRSGWDAFGISSSKHVIDICGTFHTSSSASFPVGSFLRSRELEDTRQSEWERLLHLLWESSNGKFWIIDIFIENTISIELLDFWQKTSK